MMQMIIDKHDIEAALECLQDHFIHYDVELIDDTTFSIGPMDAQIHSNEKGYWIDTPRSCGPIELTIYKATQAYVKRLK